MKKLLSTALVAVVVALPSGATGAPKAVVVFDDPAGDAGNQNQGAPGAAEAGLDITTGTIAKDGDALVFTVSHSAMPESGSFPELFRFLWHFQVDGTEYRFTVKSFDIGKPDVVAQSGTERVGQVYADGVYRLEECFLDATLPVQLSQCVVLEYLEGSFDPASKTFTFKLPLASVKAKPGSTLQGGTGGAAGTGCIICWVPHYAERSLTPQTIVDSAVQTVIYKVPKK